MATESRNGARGPARRGGSPAVKGVAALSGTAMAALLGSTAVAVLPQEALAACVVTVAPAYVCSDANTDPQVITEDNAAVTTVPGFSVDSSATAGSTALTITGAGALSYIDGNASQITGGSTGLRVQASGAGGAVFVETAGEIRGVSNAVSVANTGTGFTDVRVTGTVGATLGIGVSSSGNGISLLAGTVEAAEQGVFVQNNGTGVTNVTTQGPVTTLPGGSNAIIVNIGATAGNVSVETQDVVTAGGGFGIIVDNQGIGSTTIRALDTVTGGNAAGIQVSNGASTVGIDIEAVSVSGGTHGILAVNQGSISTRIVATGDVVGNTGSGINSYSGATVAGVTIVANNTSGQLFGITVLNDGLDAVSVTSTGLASGTDEAGIAVETFGTGLLIEANDTSGGVDGIRALNNGDADAAVISTGTATGTARAGIYAVNAATARDLTVNAAGASGEIGIAALNGGTGATTVTATGPVEGQLFGILAVNGVVDPNTVLDGFPDVLAPAGTDLTVEAASVTGGFAGIIAQNNGTGATTVTATGTVEGVLFGIAVLNEDTATDLTIQAASVTGGAAGILAFNAGTGATSVTATGPVDGGIVAQNGGDATDLTVNAASVTGGILAFNSGTGATSVTATGPVEGGGILAFNVGLDVDVNGDQILVQAGTSLTVNAAGASGEIGIAALNGGTGATTVTATGPVEGQLFGILAVNGVVNPNEALDGFPDVLAPAGTDLTVEAASVTGGFVGIFAQNNGTGATSVTATGDVEGGLVGIYAYNEATATDLTIQAANVTGLGAGIIALNGGTGSTSVITTGTVEGGEAAVGALSSGQPVSITNDGGLLRNTSGNPASLAVIAYGGPVTLINDGAIVGTVALGIEGAAFSAAFTNNGTWNTAGGTSFFFGDADVLTNAAGGTIVAAADGGAVEETVFDGLESFVNSGAFVLADGGAGDVARTGGDASFEDGSRYALDIDATGASDVFIADGDILLDGGSTLVVDASGGLLFGGRYTVMTAGGEVTGTFGAVEAPMTAFLTVEDAYDANNVYLDVIKYRDFVEAGLTRNQIATAGALDTLTGGALVTAVANLMTDEEARGAFDQVSGEAHASIKGLLSDDSRLVRDAATDRIRAAFGDAGAASFPVLAYGPEGAELAAPDTRRFAVWGQAAGLWGQRSGDGNAARIDRDAASFVLGADGLVGDWRVGVLTGYSRSDFEVRARNSSGEADSFHLGLYGGTHWDDLAFRSGFVYSWHDVSTVRSVAIGPFADTLQGSYSAGTAQIFGELAYGIDTAMARFEPFANLAYVSHRTGAFTETGGAAALSSASSTDGVAFATLGLRASTEVSFGTIDARLRGTVGWKGAFGDVTPLSTHAFAGSAAFTVAGTPIARNAALLEVGADFDIAPGATLGLSYAGQFGSGATDQSIRANFGIRF